MDVKWSVDYILFILKSTLRIEYEVVMSALIVICMGFESVLIIEIGCEYPIME